MPERISLVSRVTHRRIPACKTRELYKPAGYSSMHLYCVHELHLSKDAANKRIRAARTAREYPAAFERMEHGALRLTSLLILSSYLTTENAVELMTAAAFRSDFEVKEILAERFPQAPVPTTIEPIAEAQTLAPQQDHDCAPEQVAAQPLQSGSKSARRISNDVKREVWERDGGRCTFVGENGTRCPETRGLEWDHIEPVARGGDSRASNIRLRCRPHNQLEAERTYGKQFMQNKREEARAAAAKRRAEREAKKAAIEALDSDVLMPGLRGLGYSKAESRFALSECGPMESQGLEARLKRCLAILAPPHLKVSSRVPLH